MLGLATLSRTKVRKLSKKFHQRPRGGAPVRIFPARGRKMARISSAASTIRTLNFVKPRGRWSERFSKKCQTRVSITCSKALSANMRNHPQFYGQPTPPNSRNRQSLRNDADQMISQALVQFSLL